MNKEHGVLEVTLSLDTSAYAVGDVLVATQLLGDAVFRKGGCGYIESVTLLDKDDNGAALDLLFLLGDNSIGEENAALAIADADADEIIGKLEIGTDEYLDLTASQLYQQTKLDIPFQCLSTARSLYIAAVAREVATYTAAGITLKVGIRQTF